LAQGGCGPDWPASLFAFVGTIGLIVSLWFTKKPLDRSRQAKADQTATTRAELGAYIGSDGAQISGSPSSFRVKMSFRNTWGTMARQVRGNKRYSVGPRWHVQQLEEATESYKPLVVTDMPADGTFFFETEQIVFEHEQQGFEKDSEAGQALLIHGYTAWTDVFGRRFARIFAQTFWGEDMGRCFTHSVRNAGLLPKEEHPHLVN
jgi:hypothetical protein